MFLAGNCRHAYSVFELEHEASSDVLNNTRCATFLSFLVIGEEVVLYLIYKEHNSSSKAVRLPISEYFSFCY